MLGHRDMFETTVRLLQSPVGREENIPVPDASTHRFFDDLRIGVCLKGAGRFEALRRDYYLDHIPTLALMTALVDHLVAREDIVG